MSESYEINEKPLLDVLRQYYQDGGTVVSLRKLFLEACTNEWIYFPDSTPFGRHSVNSIMQAVQDLEELCDTSEPEPQYSILPIQEDMDPSKLYLEKYRIDLLGYDVSTVGYTRVEKYAPHIYFRKGYKFLVDIEYSRDTLNWIQKQIVIINFRVAIFARKQKIYNLYPGSSLIRPIASRYDAFTNCISFEDGGYIARSMSTYQDYYVLPSPLQIIPNRSIIRVPNWDDYVEKFICQILEAITSENIAYHNTTRIDPCYGTLLLEGLVCVLYGEIYEIIADDQNPGKLLLKVG